MVGAPTRGCEKKNMSISSMHKSFVFSSYVVADLEFEEEDFESRLCA